MARLTKPLFGVPDGEVYPREFAAGADCPPELEAAASEIGALDAAGRGRAAESKAMKPGENK